MKADVSKVEEPWEKQSRQTASQTRSSALRESTEERALRAEAGDPQWRVAFASRYVLREQTPLWGGTTGVVVAPLHIGLIALFNRRSDALGDATFGTTTATAAYDLWVIGDLRALHDASPAYIDC